MAGREVAFVAQMTLDQITRQVGAVTGEMLNGVGMAVVAEARARIGTPVAVVSKPSKSTRHVRRGRGPFKGKWIKGSRPGEYPRRETGELQDSVFYSLEPDGQGVNFFSADHGLWLEMKEPQDGGRPWISRIVEKHARRMRGPLSGMVGRGMGAALRLFRALFRK